MRHGFPTYSTPGYDPLSMSTAIIDQFDELPRIKGPKLRRFREFEYLELLSRSDDEEQLPNGDHGYVFRVQIDGELYALKIVRLGTSTTCWKLTATSFDSSTWERLL
jgi:hypothetical protein